MGLSARHSWPLGPGPHNQCNVAVARLRDPPAGSCLGPCPSGWSVLWSLGCPLPPTGPGRQAHTCHSRGLLLAALRLPAWERNPPGESCLQAPAAWAFRPSQEKPACRLGGSAAASGPRHSPPARLPASPTLRRSLLRGSPRGSRARGCGGGCRGKQRKCKSQGREPQQYYQRSCLPVPRVTRTRC